MMEHNTIIRTWQNETKQPTNLEIYAHWQSLPTYTTSFGRTIYIYIPVLHIYKHSSNSNTSYRILQCTSCMPLRVYFILEGANIIKSTYFDNCSHSKQLVRFLLNSFEQCDIIKYQLFNYVCYQNFQKKIRRFFPSR